MLIFNICILLQKKKNCSILSLGLGGVISKLGEMIMAFSSGLIKYYLLLLFPVLPKSPSPSVEKDTEIQLDTVLSDIFHLNLF